MQVRAFATRTVGAMLFGSLVTIGGVLSNEGVACATEKENNYKCGDNIQLNNHITHSYRVEIRKLKGNDCRILISCNGANAEEVTDNPISKDCEGTELNPGFMTVSCLPAGNKVECKFGTEIVP